MSTNFNTCFIDSNGKDVSEEFVEKSYLLDVYPNLIDTSKAPSLWTWGSNTNGQLGDNSSTARSSPVQTVSGGTNWKSIGGRSAAIKSDGTLWVWGFNLNGDLGDHTRTTRSSPVQTVSGGNNWKQVSHGSHFSAIKTDGTLWTWGVNNGGRLGDNNVITRSSPVQTVSAGTNWKQTSSGDGHTAAIKTDATLWLWGQNDFGQLADNARVVRSSPIQTVSGGTNWKNVQAGSNMTAAIKTDGTLWLWGCNVNGQLGDNSRISRSSPVQIVSGGTNWKGVSNYGQNTGGVKTDGTLWMWGRNTGATYEGSLGNNNQFDVSSPVQTVSGGTNWRSIATNGGVTFALKKDGTLWTWGPNDNGLLGTNDIIGRSTPVQTVSGGTNWKEALAGITIREEGDW